MNVRDGLTMLAILGLVAGIFYMHGPTTAPRTEEEKVPSIQQQQVVAEEGSPAPDLNLTTLEGKKISLSEYKGKPVLITFWTTWCGYCRNEMPIIQKAYDQYKDRVQFLIVNATAEDDEQKVREFIKEKNYTFPVLLDKEGKGASDYGVKGLPTMFLLSPEGKVQLRKSGALEYDELENLLNKALEGK